MFHNTKAFSEAGQHFLKYGFYCPDPQGSIGYKNYWEEQTRRCLNGYSVGGQSITGPHYFYLNFCQIKLTSDDKEAKKDAKKSKILTFPDFWDGDYEYFHFLKEQREKEKHVILLKTRRRGYSYKNGALAAYEYTFRRNTTTIIGAHEKRYLYPKGTMAMSNDYLNFLNAHTAFAKRRDEIDKIDHKKASFIERYPDGRKVVGGYMSEIMAITYKDNPDAARGKDAALILLEEAGAFPNLKEAYMATRPCVEDGIYTTGQIIIFGCVCAGTKVWNGLGQLVNIEDLSIEDGIIGYAGVGVAAQKILWMKPPAEKPCYRITTTSGAVLECSDDHPLLWSHCKWRDNGQKLVTFKRTDELKVGEQLMTAVQIPIFGKTHVPQARLLGLLVGDGYYGNGTPEISICGESLHTWFKGLNIPHTLHKEFITQTGETYRSYTLPTAHSLLKKIGIYGQSKGSKTLPPLVHTFDMDSTAELLGGYFDADGSVHYNEKKNTVRIVLTSKYKSLLEEVKILLFKFRISCSIVRETRKGGYAPGEVFRLYISKYEDVRQFKKHITFKCDNKQKELERPITKRGRYFYNNCKFITPTSNNKGTFYTKLNMPLDSLKAETITKIEFLGNKTVYNLNAGVTHTYITNNFISGNTGGDMESGTIDFADMFYNPEPYNLAAVENIWDEDKHGTTCGYFVPDYWNKQGFIDKDGNSLKELAKQSEEAKRAFIKRTSSDPTAIDRHVVEYPFCPAEATASISHNIFPIAELMSWSTRLKNDSSLRNLGSPGILFNEEGAVKFKPSPDVRPIMEFPMKKDTSRTGCVTIFFEPFKVDGQVPPNMYIIGHDPYAQSGEGESLGAVYVICRANRYSAIDDVIVASYVGRPGNQDEFNANMFMLAEYYNAKIGFENNTGEVIPYAKRFFKLHLLQQEFEMLDNKDLQSIRNRGYGMHMTEARKRQGELYIRDWLNTPRGVTEDGRVIKNLHKIYDPALIQELIAYSPKGNYDRVMALMIAMYHNKEVSNKEIEQVSSKDEVLKWFDEHYN